MTNKLIQTGLKVTKRISRRKGDIFYRLHRAGLKAFYPVDKQFEAFDQVLWEDGYHYTSDVTDPTNGASDGGQGVTYYEIYDKGVRPFVDEESVVLEIGPGRGAWTKGLLTAKEVWALDAKSLEHNKIMEYLNSPENLKYFQVRDFECRDLPDDYFDFVFSYGVFCHIPWEGISAYMQNIYKKMKKNAEAVIMISDDVKSPDNVNYGEWYPGCFVPNNADKMSKLLKSIGYLTKDSDFLRCKRDSIIYFTK